ncbi:MAG: type transport system permease protein [Actinomycetota bacterium]|jgi:ABC-2 type transport system permease protein|nr:type transport system permease protein [Actinomycetota bacterium]
MTTTRPAQPAPSEPSPPPTASSTSSLPVAPIRRAPSGLAADLRAIKIVCHRELLRWITDRRRLVAGMVQPLLWLFVLGTGLSRVVEPGTQGLDFRTFLFPGVLATSVMFTAVFSGVSVVWDREFGFLREMLVAPISRTSIMAGKCLGGGIVATAQALVLVALAGLAGVPYHPVMLIELVAILFLASLSITAFGLLLGARVSNIQSVMPVIQTVITPMMFLSGALYPTAGLPAWLAVATKLNPLTYAVQPMRHVVFAHLDLAPAAARALDPRITWMGWPVPVALQLVVLAALGGAVFVVAVARFSRTD